MKYDVGNHRVSLATPSTVAAALRGTPERDRNRRSGVLPWISTTHYGKLQGWKAHAYHLVRSVLRVSSPELCGCF